MQVYSRLVAFPHTVFALPFALSMFLILSPVYPHAWRVFIPALIALIAARTAAMAFNRYADATYDAKNPRTAGREIPAGIVSPREALTLCVGSSLVFLLASWWCGWHCFLLAPLVLLILLGYSLVKRFSWGSHLVLGLALSCAPGGVWYAVTAQWSWSPVPLMLAVLCWVAGFDLLYSLQDEEFDRNQGLYSLPAVFGARASRVVSVLLHLASIGLLLSHGAVFHLGKIHQVGVLCWAVLLLLQHAWVSPATIGQRFFLINGFASVAYFGLIASIVR